MAGSDTDAVAARLHSVPLFSHLSDKSVKNVVKTGALRSYKPQEKIVFKGEKGIGFYLVLDGQVEVRSDSKTVATLKPGDFFGEMALFEEQPRTADVIATTPSRCLVLSRWEFWGVMAKEPEALRELMRELVMRLRATARALSE
jgi:CRP/FNR family transcriptional regulator, cyclic AMP receptor protein